MSVFDINFQRRCLVLCVRSREFLKNTAVLLEPDDWTDPVHQEIAEIALTHWRKHGEPVGSLLPTIARDEVLANQYGKDRSKRLMKAARGASRGKIAGQEFSVDRVRKAKSSLIREKAVDEIVDLLADGKLDNASFMRLTQRGCSGAGDPEAPSTDYYAEYAQRVQQRQEQALYVKRPWLAIPPLDHLMPEGAIGRGDLGCYMAPSGRGKSLLLAHTARAYTLQGWNVLYITLEDPMWRLTKRLDSMVTSIPLEDLTKNEHFKFRFRDRAKYAAGKLWLVDRTYQDTHPHDIDAEWLTRQQRGEVADVIIVDYDQEIKPALVNKERRFDYESIYTDLGQLARKRSVVLWTAAQTQRKTEDIKQLKAEKLAEDVYKWRKVSMLIGLGRDTEWDLEVGNDVAIGLHAYIAKFRDGTGHQGVSFTSDYKRAKVFSQENTDRRHKQLKKIWTKKNESDGDEEDD